MASQADIAAAMIAGLAPPSGNSDTGFEIGQVVSWDELSGVNTITVRGTTMNNLKCIQSGIGVLYQAGDTVAIFRFQTNYFVWGKIAAPGASSAAQIRSNTVNGSVNIPLQGFGDAPGSPGPSLASVYIGSSRRALVMLSALINTNNSIGEMGFQVSNASSISPINDKAAYFGSSPGVGQVAGYAGSAAWSSATKIVLLSASDGLNQGFNDFTCKYSTLNAAGGGTAGSGAFFQSRSLTVIPF